MAPQILHKKLPTGERVHKRDYFHDQRCASCLCSNEEQINVMRNTVDTNLCDILQEGLMAYFIGECMTNTMFSQNKRKEKHGKVQKFDR